MEDNRIKMHTHFIETCLKRSKNKINELLNGNTDIDINYINLETSKSVIHTLCESAKPEVIKLILSKKQYSDVKDNAGRTPIYEAIYRKSTKIIHELLAHGACINVRDGGGCTPLHHACAHSNMDVIKFLLSQNADVHQRDSNGRTTLIIAAIRFQNRERREKILEETDLLKLLVTSGVNINTRDNTGWTCLHHIVVAEKLKNITMMIKLKCDVNCKSSEDVWISDTCVPKGSTPLHMAIIKRNFDVIKLVYNSGANFNEYFGGNTPITWCIEKSDSKMMKQLLHYGSSAVLPKTNEQKEIYPMTLCIENSLLKMAQTLMEYGAKLKQVQCKGSEDGTILHKVIKHCDKPHDDALKTMVESLLDQGDCINVKDTNGNTPLLTYLELLKKKQPYGSRKIRSKSEYIAKLLISATTDINIHNNEGFSPLLFAFTYLRHTWNTTNLFKSILSSLIAKGADINDKNKSGETILHLWSKVNDRVSGSELFERSFVSGSCVINAVNDKGQTPLYTSLQKLTNYSFSGDEKYCMVLITEGASLFCQDIYGITILHLIACRDMHLNMTLMGRRLLENPNHHEYINLRVPPGPNTLLTFENLTALQIALKKGNTSCVNIFLQAGSNVHYTYPSSDSFNSLIQQVIQFMKSNTGRIYLRGRHNIAEQVYQTLYDLITAGASIGNLTDVKKGTSEIEVLLFTQNNHLFKLLARNGYPFDWEFINQNLDPNDVTKYNCEVKILKKHCRLSSLERLAASVVRKELYPNAWVSAQKLQLPDFIHEKYFSH